MMATLGDFMADYEAELLAKSRAEMEREAAEWAALTPAEQAALHAAREAKFAAFQDNIDAAEPDDDDDEEEE